MNSSRIAGPVLPIRLPPAISGSSPSPSLGAHDSRSGTVGQIGSHNVRGRFEPASELSSSTWLQESRLVRVVVVPPHVGRGLWIALGRVLPLLLTTQGSDVEIAPCAPHRLVT